MIQKVIVHMCGYVFHGACLSSSAQLQYKASVCNSLTIRRLVLCASYCIVACLNRFCEALSISGPLVHFKLAHFVSAIYWRLLMLDLH